MQKVYPMSLQTLTFKDTINLFEKRIHKSANQLVK